MLGYKKSGCWATTQSCCKVRTPDPYVPNVVRYQLRYIPIFHRRILRNRLQSYGKKMKYVQKKGYFFRKPLNWVVWGSLFCTYSSARGITYFGDSTCGIAGTRRIY